MSLARHSKKAVGESVVSLVDSLIDGFDERDHGLRFPEAIFDTRSSIGLIAIV